MSRRWIAPLAAGLLTAGVAFAIVRAADDDSGPSRQAAVVGGPRDSGSGRAIFGRMGCGSCHRLAAADSTGQIGPDLDERLQHHTRESLTAVILQPPAGSVMPEDFGARMDEAEFDALVDFLLAQREPH